jgi:hypothetical protein
MNTIVAPLKTKALAVETNVKEGMMTSSPGLIPERIADISNASVQEVVRRHFPAPVLSQSHS